MEQENKTFHYTYSAKEQAEIEKIRKKYCFSEEDKLEQLRQLDSSVSQKARIWAVALGILGSLIMGTGMSLAMTDLSQILGMEVGTAMVLGIVIGLLGLIMVALAYPVYNAIVIRQRKRLAPRILQLTEELRK